MRVKLRLLGPIKYFASPLHTSPCSRSHRITQNITEKMATINKTAHPFDKSRLEALLNRRFFFAPAFEIYGGMRPWLPATMKPQELIEPFLSQVSLVSTTTARLAPLSRLISSQNGESTSSSKRTCLNWIPHA